MHLTLWIHPVMLVLVIIVLLFVVRNFTAVKRMVIGRPLRSKELEAKQNKPLWYIALLILSADLYSSVAYGPEAGVTEFAFLGSSALWILIPIVIATVLLLVIIVLSYH
jgi:hypothetical protein